MIIAGMADILLRITTPIAAIELLRHALFSDAKNVFS